MISTQKRPGERYIGTEYVAVEQRDQLDLFLSGYILHFRVPRLLHT